MISSILLWVFGASSALALTDITNCAELQAIDDNLAEDYRLTQNIDCSGVSNFNVIGSSVAPFTGTFDGQGFVVDGVEMSSFGAYTAPFAVLGSTGTIQNVGFHDVDVISFASDFAYVSGLVAQNYGTIQSSYVTGVVSASGWYVGGLVGSNESTGTIHQSHASATVESTAPRLGGLVGQNNGGDITQSYATGNVAGTSNQVGGLAGLNFSSGTISNSFSSGDVTGGSSVGGFVGLHDSGTITNSYTRSNTTAGDYGFASGGASVVSSYWDGEVSSADATVSALGTERTTAQMKNNATYSGWDFSTIWNRSDGTNDGYPFLRFQNFPPSPGVTIAGTPLAITESGTADSFSLVLDAAPSADVAITLGASGGEFVLSSSDARFSSGVITFTSANWDSVVLVDISAVDDIQIEGDHSDTITFSVSSVDAGYNGLSVSGVSVSIADNDPSLNIVASTTASGVAGESTAIPVSLSGASAEDVPVTLVVTNGTLAMSTTAGLTFTGPTTGSTLQFSGSLENVNAALATLTYTRGSAGSDTLEISLVEPGEVFFEDTGNLYEYITFAGTWQEAEAHAQTLTRYGATGYLTTITSGAENDFVSARLEGAGWMGASDAASEGDWRWVTGPEAGTSFWSGASDGSAVGGAYENWNTGEPNDFSTGEDCGQFLAGSSGLWNDLPCTGVDLAGYVAEFGQDGDEVTVVADTVSITTVSVTEVGSCVDWNDLPSTASGNIRLTSHLSCGASYQTINLGPYNFDGGGYTVIISGVGTQLFSSVTGGIIEDLRLEGEIDGDGDSYASPLVENASAGSVVRRVASYIDMNNVGSYGSGLVGILNNSIIEDSYVAGDIESDGSNYVGGMVGYIINDALMRRVYMSGSITSPGARVGGLVGLMNGTGATATSVIRDSFVAGEITGSATLSGALVGLVGAEIDWQTDDVLINNYYDATRTGKDLCAIANAMNVGDEDEVCQAINTSPHPDTTYFFNSSTNPPLNDWDFSSVWFTNSTHPLLRESTDPIILSVTPSHLATSVPVNTNLVIIFNEPVDSGVGNIVIRRDSDDVVVESVEVGGGRVSGLGTRQLTVDLVSDLVGDTVYYIGIDAGAYRDLADNDFAGISDSDTWSFTTGEGVAPTIDSITPNDNTTGVAVDTDLVITFTEPVDAESGTIAIKKASDDSTVETFDVTTDITGSGTAEITINPSSDLGYETAYYVQIDATAFDDTAGNSFAGIADTTTWNFTTENAPVCPTVSNATSYNAYPTCGVATCASGFALEGGQCVANIGASLPAGALNPPQTPMGGFKLIINDGVSQASSPAVTLHLVAGADTVSMALSRTGDFTDAVIEPYQSIRAWNLNPAGLACADNPFCDHDEYAVYARFYTTWGTSSPIVRDTIRVGVVPESKDSCQSISVLTRPIRFGTDNNPADVRLLETFLNTYEGSNLPIDGVYSASDQTAVIAWQEKYAEDILAPWNLTEGTGYVYRTSLQKMREIIEQACETDTNATPTQNVTQSADFVFTRNLYLGVSGADVRALQRYLNNAGYIITTEGPGSPGQETDFFGSLTRSALIMFQRDNNISPAVGYFGPITRAVVNGG